jgi:hypothetical protein
LRANAWEGIGKELKIKLKFYVSSRDLRIVCPWLKATVETVKMFTRRWHQKLFAYPKVFA